MILKFKKLIYCAFNSHNEVLMRILGLKYRLELVANIFFGSNEAMKYGTNPDKTQI